MYEENKNHIRQRLYEICKDCHCQNPTDPFCTLIEILMYKSVDSRYLVQLKCIEKFQYVRAHEQNREVLIQEATNAWINEGWASLFEKHYKTDMLIETLFNNIMSDKDNLVPFQIQL